MGLDDKPPDDGNVVTGTMFGLFITVGLLVFIALAGWAWRLL
jgi:hypothetical protein